MFYYIWRNAMPNSRNEMESLIEPLEGKNRELYETIYKSVTEGINQENLNDIARNCKKLFKQGANPEVLIQLEELLRERQNEKALAKHINPSKQKNSPKTSDKLKESLIGQKEHYNNYIQKFLPALLRETTQSKN